MKAIQSILLLLVLTCFACSEEEAKSADLQTKNEPVRLELVAMSGQLRGSEITGDAMEWQEYFLLKNDMKFEKVQVREGKKASSSGTFEIVMINGDKHLEFKHNTKNDVYGNCTGNKVELLRYTGPSELQGSWSACDGPGLEYAFK